MKRAVYSWIVGLLFLALGASNTAQAEISEPDYLIFGEIIIEGVPITAADTGVSVEAYVDAELIASYIMGDNTDIGDRFLLKIPMDSFGEQAPGTARRGDEITVIFLGLPEALQTSFPLDDHGRARKLDAVDTDGDGEYDFNDDDDDNDGVPDSSDNCTLVANPDQVDTDGDGQGDACDEDDDNDGVDDINDDLPLDPTDSVDSDGDQVGDSSDNCPNDANPDQKDTDDDGLGDACDPDIDWDGWLNTLDNCPVVWNPLQIDLDDDGIGDLCDECLGDPENKCAELCFPIPVPGGGNAIICL